MSDKKEGMIEVCEHCDTPIYEWEDFFYDVKSIPLCLECAEEVSNKKEYEK